jgi:hypothetical protein
MDSMSSDFPGQQTGPAIKQRISRSRRLAASVAAGAMLLGSGIAIGVAVTGGASAAARPGTAASAKALAQAAGPCRLLVGELRSAGHPVAPRRLLALCENPMIRLALVGGIHGQVTLETKQGPKTLAFERGTVESASGSTIVVKAPDGTEMTWDVVGNTVVREAGHQVTAGDVGSGDLVLVVGQVVSGANDARLIRIRPAA